MKYFLQINQVAIIENNIKIGLEEAVLLDYLFWLCSSLSEEVEKERIKLEDGKYTWFDYDFFLKELPILKGRTKPTVTAKIKKLEKERLIKTVIKKKRKYVRLLPKTDLLFRKNLSLRNLNDIVKKTKRDKYIKKINNLSKDKLTKKFGNGKVNLILEEFEIRFKRKPVDIRPRQVAWNMVRNICRGYKNVFGKDPTDEEFKNTVKKVFDWFMEKDFAMETYRLDTVRRYVKAVLEKIISSKKTPEFTPEFPEQTPEERKKALEKLDKIRRELVDKFGINLKNIGK